MNNEEDKQELIRLLASERGKENWKRLTPEQRKARIQKMLEARKLKRKNTALHDDDVLTQ